MPTFVDRRARRRRQDPAAADYVVGRDGDDLLLRNFEGDIYRYPDPDGTRRRRPADAGRTSLMRIGLVYDLRDDYLALGYSEEEIAEFDSDGDDRCDLAGALAALGCEPARIGRGQALAARLVAGERWDLVFNIAEGLKGRSREAQVPALCELFDIPYVFSDPLTLALLSTRRWPSGWCAMPACRRRPSPWQSGARASLRAGPTSRLSSNRSPKAPAKAARRPRWCDNAKPSCSPPRRA